MLILVIILRIGGKHRRSFGSGEYKKKSKLPTSTLAMWLSNTSAMMRSQESLSSRAAMS